MDHEPRPIGQRHEGTHKRNLHERRANENGKAIAGIKPGPFVKISYDPHPSSIDLKLTDALAKSRGMTRAQFMLNNLAVLKKGGQKVRWDRDAEPEK